MSLPITVRVNAEFGLDFGRAEEICREDRVGLLITPPVQPVYEQLVGYLLGKPEPPRRSRTNTELEALAATALTVRWGSYYAVLADLKHQDWRFNERINPFGIFDSEMARINIEASFAMSRWIERYVSDRYRESSHALARRAVAYLPICKSVRRADCSIFRVSSEDAQVLKHGLELTAREQLVERARRNPWRVLGNAMIDFAYRNGPIEDVHGGRGIGVPSTTPQLTTSADRHVQAITHGRMKVVHALLWALEGDRDFLDWPERALPYGLRVPTWSLDESSREVYLPFAAQRS